MGWTVGIFSLEQCRMVRCVIYKMSCYLMNRQHHIWGKMAFSHDNSFPKNVNCRTAIWKSWFQNKHLCYFPLLFDLLLKVRHSSYTLKHNRHDAIISLHKPFFLHDGGTNTPLRGLLFPAALPLATLFPMAGMFSLPLPLIKCIAIFHNCKSYLSLQNF